MQDLPRGRFLKGFRSRGPKEEAPDLRSGSCRGRTDREHYFWKVNSSEEERQLLTGWSRGTGLGSVPSAFRDFLRKQYQFDTKTNEGRETFMTDKLNQPTVLVLNRNWQAINTRSPANAITQMATDVATALDIDGDMIRPVKWSEWITLPVREQDGFVATAQRQIRLPTVIVLCNYAKVPMRVPSLGTQGIWERDGSVCQYTGRKVSREDGNIDHIIPRSRGGKTSWENCVVAHREINSRKGNRTPEEVGLRLLKVPTPPKLVPVTLLLKNKGGHEDWARFFAG